MKEYDTANGIFQDKHLHKVIPGIKDNDNDEEMPRNDSFATEQFGNRKFSKFVPEGKEKLDLSKGLPNGSTFIPDDKTERKEAMDLFGIEQPKPKKTFEEITATRKIGKNEDWNLRQFADDLKATGNEIEKVKVSKFAFDGSLLGDEEGWIPQNGGGFYKNIYIKLKNGKVIDLRLTSDENKKVNYVRPYVY